MHARSRYVDPSAIGTVDVALWDIAGKVAGLPVHRLLGTYRHTVPVYFSSGLHPRAEAYAEEATYWREQGWKGYKLHPPTSPYAVSPEVAPVQADIDGCVAVHDAVGGTMALMLDASWAYSYAEALTVGRAIEELGFTWYEDPLPAEDLYGCRKLVQHLDIPVLATELTLGGLYTLPQWITERATDMLRGDVVIKGGITGMMKIGHLAEAFHMKCEVHDAYNAMNNVATAHLVMAMPQLRLVRGPRVQPRGRPQPRAPQLRAVRAAAHRRRGLPARADGARAGRRRRLGADRLRPHRRPGLVVSPTAVASSSTSISGNASRATPSSVDAGLQPASSRRATSVGCAPKNASTSVVKILSRTTLPSVIPAWPSTASMLSSDAPTWAIMSPAWVGRPWSSTAA